MKYLLLVVLLVVMSCASAGVPHSFVRQSVQISDTTSIIRSMSELGYPIDFKDESAGVVNTGWYNFNVLRGVLKISWAIRSRVLFVIKEGAAQMTFECQASYGSALGGQQWQPVNDPAGVSVAEEERARVLTALGGKE